MLLWAGARGASRGVLTYHSESELRCVAVYGYLRGSVGLSASALEGKGREGSVKVGICVVLTSLPLATVVGCAVGYLGFECCGY